jgi:hypothetical protein
MNKVTDVIHADITFSSVRRFPTLRLHSNAAWPTVNASPLVFCLLLSPEIRRLISGERPGRGIKQRDRQFADLVIL